MAELVQVAGLGRRLCTAVFADANACTGIPKPVGAPLQHIMMVVPSVLGCTVLEGHVSMVHASMERCNHRYQGGMDVGSRNQIWNIV